MKSRAWRRKGRQGIGPLQIQVLTFLRSRPNHSATVSTIARELSVKLPTASEVIRTLEHKRLVRRRRREIDNRVVTVHLTALGAKAGHVENRWPEILASATENLSMQEQVALLDRTREADSRASIAGRNSGCAHVHILRAFPSACLCGIGPTPSLWTSTMLRSEIRHFALIVPSTWKLQRKVRAIMPTLTTLRA